MSNFWSNYIIAIVALNIIGCVWLLMWTRKMDLTDLPSDGTTGHEYDGIREYNNPLPRWWLMLFWITIAFSVGLFVPVPGHGQVPRDTWAGRPRVSMPRLTSSTTSSTASFMPTMRRFRWQNWSRTSAP
jgi:hypothetical protein